MVLHLDKWLSTLIKEINSEEYESITYYRYYWSLRNSVGSYLDFLTRVDEGFEHTKDPIHKWAPKTPHYRGLLQEILGEIEEEYSKITSFKLEQLKVCTSEESERINESFHCLMEGCCWSAVINSAVALESRLFLILKRRSKKTLESINPRLRFTLGQLADAYLKNKSAFKNCIPPYYEHLLKLVNQYRIFSAHPKRFNVDRKTADGIFNFTLDFLLDKECEPPKKKGRKKKSP